MRHSNRKLLARAFAFIVILAVGQAPRSAANPQATPGGGQPSAASALAALDTISDKEWLTQSSRALLERVIAASSRAALDEAAKSDPRAQALVGSGYYFGVSGYPQSDAEAAKYYRLSARTSAIAQINLGNMIESGRVSSGELPPLALAASFYRQAALQGHPLAESNLGLMYKLGRGVGQDYKQAAAWLSRAAAQGVARAQWELAGLLPRRPGRCGRQRKV
jgi:TPR repeat protein